MSIRESAHRLLQHTLPFIVVLLFCVVSSCRTHTPAPVAVTYLHAWWLQPDELPRAEREFRAFTRDTGIAIQHSPVPETLFSSLDPRSQQELLRRPLDACRPTPHLLPIPLLSPAIP